MSLQSAARREVGALDERMGLALGDIDDRESASSFGTHPQASGESSPAASLDDELRQRQRQWKEAPADKR